MNRLRLLLAAVLVAVTVPVHAADKRPMTVDDLFRFRRVSDPQISPDGKQIAYVVGAVDMDRNTIPTSLWVVPVDGSAPPRQLTNAPGKKDRHPRWSPDGRYLLFESNRSGEMQLWLIALAGGEARQLTTITSDASSGIWARDGKQIAFVSSVYPEYSDKPFKESDALNKKREDESEKSPVKAKTFTRLFYRHWDSYVEDKRQHLFVMSFADGVAGEPKDVTPGDRDAYPTSMTFETGENYTFSPDGTHLVFTAVPEKDEAWSTNYDLCRVPVTGGSATWECLTKGNAAADSGPAFSPDGKTLAYRAQKKAGYEADKWELITVPVRRDGAFAGEPASLTADFDSAPGEYAWMKGEIYFVAEEKGNSPIFMVRNGTKKVDRWYAQGTIGALTTDARGETLAFTVAGMNHPNEIFAASYAHAPRQLTHVNKALREELALGQPESVTVAGAGGTPMQMWILKPPGFDAAKKWPVAFLVHGGPQSAWEDTWSYRWNAQTWAGQGYVVVLPNPRGSTGFGQKYIDEITGDWGGKCYEDLMKGLDHVVNLPYVDKDRVGAAGGSFGGYMMNWFAVNTNRFKTLVTHCSVYNFESMYATTDEIWFDEYEHGGPPWGKNRDSYEKQSPHRLAGNLGKYRTPMLIIHNDLDFRCPIGQGHELFTALKRQGVEARFVNFPDEGHWVLKPQNSRHWYNEVFAWMKRHVPPGGR